MPEGDKTEKATPKKRRDERKKGNVFLSKDAVAVASLLGSFAALKLMAPIIVAQVEGFLFLCMRYAGALGTGQLYGMMEEIVVQGITVVIVCTGPILGVTCLCTIAATFLQTKLLVSGQSIKPKFSHISPLQGIKRLFSLRSLVEALKGTIKIAVLLFIIYNYLTGVVSTLSNYLHADVGAAAVHLFDETFNMVMQVALAFTVLAGFDFFYQWWEYERQMRMSKQEIKEEYKQMEGDPQVKGKIKEIQRKLAQSRMMQKVPQADVIIRNPTHVAVALRYKPDIDPAPLVLAKGLDELALRIVKVAEENGVAVVENVPLARSLYASAELDREIPSELYGAVADVLVYIYKLGQGKK